MVMTVWHNVDGFTTTCTISAYHY